MILVSDNGVMTAQGHTRDAGAVTGAALTRRPRRRVVLGSLGSLAVGVALAVTALPAVANSSHTTPTDAAPRPATHVDAVATSRTSSVPVAPVVTPPAHHASRAVNPSAPIAAAVPRAAVVARATTRRPAEAAPAAPAAPVVRTCRRWPSR